MTLLIVATIIAYTAVIITTITLNKKYNLDEYLDNGETLSDE